MKTLVTRLLKKKPSRGQGGRGVFLSPAGQARGVGASESRGLIDRLFKGEVAPLVAHFAANKQLSAKDIRELKALVKKIEEDE